METLQKQSPLLEALANFEFCLETPVVPGEMDLWVEIVDKAHSELETELNRAWSQDHPDKLAEISQEDSEMLRRVTILETNDKECQEKHKAFVHKLHNAAGRAPKAEPDEARLEDRIEDLIDTGLALVLDIRRQEVALDYWLLEALERDRGIAD